MARKIFFGSLEQVVMAVLWRHGPSTVRQVLDRLRGRKFVAYTTIMTVMNRLADQGLLRRRAGANSAFVYAPTHSQTDHEMAASKASVERLVAAYGDVALIQFMARLDSVPDAKLQRLRQVWRKKRSR
jgi:predicted transcriptional regulator